MNMANFLSSGQHQRSLSTKGGKGVRKNLATSLMFGLLVRVLEGIQNYIKYVPSGITVHEILSFGRRPYKDIRPKIKKDKVRESLVEFMKKKRTMEAPNKYLDYDEAMYIKVIK